MPAVPRIASPATPPTISASALLERLARGVPTQLLDVRDDPAAWRISAPAARAVAVPAADALADVAGLARELDEDAVVVCNRGVTAGLVANELRARGAHARVLTGGMRGWIGALRAVPVELGIDGLTVLQVQRPGRGCLSYLLAAAGEAIVVDPAPDAGFYVRLATEAGARVTTVLDTHLHADHLSGARELAERTGAALRLPVAALERGVADAQRFTALRDGETIELGPALLTAVTLPGHTTDMTGLLVDDRALLAGDSLFADGIARPDLQRREADGTLAMARRLHATLHERVLALGDDVVLLPGHDHPVVRSGAVAPTLGAVRAQVPELAIDDADAFARTLVSAMPARPANYEAVIAVNAGTRPFDPELETGGNACAAR